MSVLERVSLLNSYQTLLNDDSDFSRFESRLTNFGSGILFSDMATKPEFNVSGTSGTATITSGEAIITTTRATSSPITGKKTPVRYQLSDTKTLTGLVSGSKIYIEIDQTLIDNPTLIQDTYPSTDYANGLNIGTLTHGTSRPATNTYIPLWELSGITWTWTDLRTTPKILANRIDFVDVDGNIGTEGNITAQDITALGKMSSTGDISSDENMIAKEFFSPSGGLQEQIDQINTDIGTPQEFLDDSFMLGEPVLAGQCVFLETGPATGVATTKQNIGDVAGNTRVSFPVIGTGVAGGAFKVNICKTGATHPADQGLYFRIETDNSGSPSGTLVNPNAIAHILPADLTTSLADTTMTLAGSITIPEGEKCHLVAFQSTSDDYADTVIDAGDYYNIGYSTNNTTTRGVKLFDGSVYGSYVPAKWCYVSSNLFQNKLLSLTDSDYAYKIDLVGISTESKGIGTYPKLTIQGINGEQSGLTKDIAYFLGATPGSLSASIGTNGICIGKGLTANKLLLFVKYGNYIGLNQSFSNSSPNSTAYSSVYQNTTGDGLYQLQITVTGGGITNGAGIQISPDGSNWITIYDVLSGANIAYPITTSVMIPHLYYYKFKAVNSGGYSGAITIIGKQS